MTAPPNISLERTVIIRASFLMRDRAAAQLRREVPSVTLLRRLFGKGATEATPPPEHAVVVHFTYGTTDLSRLFSLENELRSAIERAAAGEYDGNEMAMDGSDGYLYMYGPNADALFEVVRPSL